jgi:hypothetical protein
LSSRVALQQNSLYAASRELRLAASSFIRRKVRADRGTSPAVSELQIKGSLQITGTFTGAFSNSGENHRVLPKICKLALRNRGETGILLAEPLILLGIFGRRMRKCLIPGEYRLEDQSALTLLAGIQFWRPGV